MRANKMVYVKVRTGASAALAFIALLLAAGCKPAASTPVNLSPPEVLVAQPLQAEVAEFAVFTGRTEAVDSVDVRARVSGYLIDVAFDDGAEVAANQDLFLIDSRPYQNVLDSATAALQRADALAARAKSDLARAEQLLPQGVIQRETYDRAVADSAQAVADQMAAAAAVAQAQLDLSFTTVKSPIDGRISRNYISEGNLVVADNTLLTNIVSKGTMHVYFDVDEQTMLSVQQRIREGKLPSARGGSHPPVRMAVATDVGFPYSGYVDFVETRVDAATGTLRVRAYFDDETELLSPGLFVRVRLITRPKEPMLLVPEQAIGSDQTIKFVYVLNENDEVVYRPVTLGPRRASESGGALSGDFRAVSGDLKATDRVIVEGLQRVRPGLKVVPKPAELPNLLPDDDFDTEAAPAAPAPADAPATSTPPPSTPAAPAPAPPAGTTIPAAGTAAAPVVVPLLPGVAAPAAAP